GQRHTRPAPPHSAAASLSQRHSDSATSLLLAAESEPPLVTRLLIAHGPLPAIEHSRRPGNPVVDALIDAGIDLTAERLVEVVGQLLADPLVPGPGVELVTALLILAQVPERRPAHEQE